MIHETSGGHGIYHRKRLPSAALELTSLLCRIAPHISKILAAVENNSMRFLSVVHFALSCLHRRTALPRAMRTTSIRLSEHPVADRKAFLEMPFCENRRVQVGETGEMIAAAAAVQRVKKLESMVDDRMFSGFHAKPAGYQPGVDEQARRARFRDVKRNEILAEEYQRLLKSLSAYVDANDSARSRGRLERIGLGLRGGRQSLEHLAESVQELTRVLLTADGGNGKRRASQRAM